MPQINALTEQRLPDSMHLDQLSTIELLQLINREDQKVATAITPALPQIAQAVEMMSQSLRGGGRIIYIGAGTSGRLGVLDAVECEPTFSLPPDKMLAIIAGGKDAMFRAVEGAEDDQLLAHQDLAAHQLSAKDCLVAIAASGRTPYTQAAAEYAKNRGAATIALCNNPDAPLLQKVDLGICIPVGAEVLTGSTRMKAGTSQKLVLNMLSTATMVKLGKVYQNLMVDLKATNHKLKLRAQNIVMETTGCDSETAIALLEQSQYEVKPAILMHLCGVDYKNARASLNKHAGHLRKALAELQGDE